MQGDNQNIVLYGGGLDSTAVVLILLRNGFQHIRLLHVDYGQKAMLSERRALLHFATKYNLAHTFLTMDMSYSKATIMRNTGIGDAESNRLELRNLALISYAASYAASMFDNSKLYVGFHVEPPGSGFLDAKREYLHSLQQSINLATDRRVVLTAPLDTLTRQEIFSVGYQIDKDIVEYSHTCYEEVVCGKCTHCVEKEKMLKEILKLGDTHA